MQLPELQAALEAEQKNLEREVFEHAPADWAAYKERLGRWQGVQVALDVIADVIDKERQDEARQ